MMKNMRYLILLLAAAFSFAGCDDDEVLGKQNAGKERPEVTITPGGVTDTEAAFTLSVSAGAQEYGYVVLQDTALDTPSAYDILTNSVAGTVSRGVYSTEEAASQTVSFACEANAVYTVFAAAITSTGLTSKVNALKLAVDDTEGPVPVSFEALSGNSLMVAFNEPLYFNPSADVQAVVRYYKPGASRIEGKVVITDGEPIARENISISGSTATFTVTAHPGATFLVDIPSGLFTDAAGNLCTGVTNSYNEDSGDFSAAHGDMPAAPFAILPDYFETPAVGTDWSAEGASLSFTVPSVIYEDNQVLHPVRVAYNEANGVMYLNADYEVKAGVSETTVTVTLPKAPAGTFDLDIAEGAFFDEWGNPSAAFRMDPEDFRYMQTIVLQTGRYLVAFTPLNEYTGETVLSTHSGEAFELGLQPVPGQEGLYMIGTSWFNMFDAEGFVLPAEGGLINPVLVGKVDYATRTIVFDGTYLNPADMSIQAGNALNTAFYVNAAEVADATEALVFQGGGEDGTAPITITFNEEGKLQFISKCAFVVKKFQGEHDGEFVAYYDGIGETGTLTYTPED